MEKPPLPKISTKEGEDLIKRIKSQLHPEEFSLVSSIIRSYMYVQWGIKEAKIGWGKLCRYFGLMSRSKANNEQNNPQHESDDDKDGETTTNDASMPPISYE